MSAPLAAVALVLSWPAIAGRRIHRSRRRLRAPLVVPRPLHDDRHRDCVAADLAVPGAVARRSRARSRRARSIKRLIVVGLDGQDPKLTDRFMKEGLLPNFSKLAEDRLLPPAADDVPVGLAGGVVVVQHRRRTRRATTSSTSSIAIAAPTCRCCRRRASARSSGSSSSAATGFRCDKPELRLLRKSKPFWTILGEHRIWSTVLRVPITFPPDRFYGAELSAMCVPDLLGTQGTFLLFTTRPRGGALQGRRHARSGRRSRAIASRRRFKGPENMFVERIAAARDSAAR